jgi:polyisoprenoid-binding protein YceI
MRSVALLALMIALTVPTPGEAAESPQRFRLHAAGTRVGFELGATLHTVRGVVGEVSGEVTALERQDGGFDLEGGVRIVAASIDSGTERRDRRMREEQLDVAHHPEIVFTAKELAPAGVPAGSTGAAPFLLRGTLTLRGVAREIEMAASLHRGVSWVIEGRTEVALADYGMPNPSTFLVKVAPLATVSFRAVFVPED